MNRPLTDEEMTILLGLLRQAFFRTQGEVDIAREAFTLALTHADTKREQYAKAAPLCDKHKPNGGHRAMCLVCAGEKLCAALSRISYACEEPNEEEMSSYDLHCDENYVVQQVQKLRAECEALLAGKHGYANGYNDALNDCLTNGLQWARDRFNNGPDAAEVFAAARKEQG